jgi:(p)ppGpp synthase/HD superfamily hydrolase
VWQSLSAISENIFRAVNLVRRFHDVVEDTRVTLADLRAWHVDARTVELVDLLTKKNAPDEPETEEYYQDIAHDDTAVLVKFCDRAANLEDVLSEVKRGNVRRWKAYVDRTYTDVLPMYVSLPALRAELEARLKAIEDAIIEVRGGDPNGAFDCGAAV